MIIRCDVGHDDVQQVIDVAAHAPGIDDFGHLPGGIDTETFTRNLESAYRTMWQGWLAGEPAKGFAVGT